MEKIIWIYSQWKWNYWFIDLEDKSKWYFCFWLNNNKALPWDKVEAKVKIFKWKQEAVVTKIIERRKAPIVWKLMVLKSFGFVIPNNSDIKNDIFIAWRYLKNFKDWDIVSVEIIKWDGKKPEWKIINKLWVEWDRWVDILSIALEWWARVDFPWIVRKSLDKLSWKINPKEFRVRKDLRRLLTYTIDWEDSKDLDDAISIKYDKKWNYTLYVHIADVSYYVTEGSPLDKEAKKRWNSIYLVDKVIPMLPEKLSNNLCSLNPNTEKLTLTCEIEVNSAGHIVNSNVYESIINSDFRLTYREVDEINNSVLLEWSPLMFWWLSNKELIDNLKLASDLQLILSKYKSSIWVLEFDFPESKIILDDNWFPIDFKKYPSYNSNKIIEEFMVLANEAVSTKFSNVPFLYRIHPKPDPEDIEKLQKSLDLFWIKSRLNKFTSLEISTILKEIKWLSSEKVLSRIILRTLTKAIYSPDPEWHFGLALDYYSHFTSPIRRYSDLQIHRIIRESIHWKLTKARKNHFAFILDSIAKKCSDMEQKAEKLEYKVKDLMAVKYMKDKIWEEYTATISWVIQSWFFVELDNTIEWFIELDKSRVILNDETMSLKDLKSWKDFRIWDKLNVELKWVDEKLLRIEFKIK